MCRFRKLYDVIFLVMIDSLLFEHAIWTEQEAGVGEANRLFIDHAQARGESFFPTFVVLVDLQQDV